MKKFDKSLIILGNSGAGKDTLALRIGQFLPIVNLKFGRFAKDWVDQIYGGSFESDRFEDLGGFTKDLILVDLFELFQRRDPAASVRAMRNWLNDKALFGMPVFTDVRTPDELAFVYDVSKSVKVIALKGGSAKKSDRNLPLLVQTASARDEILVCDSTVSIVEVLSFLES